MVTLPDLQSSLDSILTSRIVQPSGGSATGRSTGFGGSNMNQNAPSNYAGLPPELQPSPAARQLAPELNKADTPAPAAPATTATDSLPQPSAASATPDSFGGLDMDFLRNMQSALEDLGYDLTSQNIMEQLASDQTVAAKLLPLLLTSSSSTRSDGATMAEWVRQWQQAIQEQMEVEKQLAKKQQRPVWRCRVCGSYGCPVAPYIEYMEDVG